MDRGRGRRIHGWPAHRKLPNEHCGVLRQADQQPIGQLHFLNHFDDYFPTSVTCAEVADRFSGLIERIGTIDH